MNTKRILVVDDHGPTRDLIKAFLRAETSATYEVVPAANGKAALDAIRQALEPFDLILLDVEMPDLDGFTVCRTLREWKVKTPVVFLTGRGGLQDFGRGRDAGGDSYVVKPLARGRVMSVIHLFTNVARKRDSPAGR